MPNYIFQHKINTLAELRKPFEYDGFRFEAHNTDFQEGSQDGWIAEKKINASNVDEARNQFFPEFHSIVNKIAALTQCFTVVDYEPYLVKRTDDRPEFFLNHTKSRKAVPLHFTSREEESLRALEQYEQKGDVFHYLRAAINSRDFYGRMAMLCSTMEAIVGEKIKGQTNRQGLKSFLGDDDLEEKIFGGQTGIRNQLLHGKKIDDELHGGINYTKIIYEKIIEHFNDIDDVSINESVVSAPRTKGGNYSVWYGWLKPTTAGFPAPDLRRLCELDIDEATKGTEFLKKAPSDY